MSRRRYISTLISIDQSVRNLSDSAALLYTWMIPHAEDDATLTANPGTLAALVVPNRPGWTPEVVESCLTEMEEEGLFIVANCVIHFPPETFYKYQSNIPDHKRRKDQPERKPSSERVQKKIPKAAENSASPSPSPSPMPSPSTTSVVAREDAGTLTAYFIDQSRGTEHGYTSADKGQVSKYCKELLDQGIPYAHIKAGIDRMIEKTLAPRLLGQLTNEAKKDADTDPLLELQLERNRHPRAVR